MTTDRPDIPLNIDDDVWRERSARIAARRQSERRSSFYRILSGVHAFSAFGMIAAAAGAFLHAGAMQWPWWYSCMIVAASILPLVSGASAWFMKEPKPTLFFFASISVVLPLAFAGYYRSPMLWANVLVIGALAYVRMKQGAK